MEYIPNDNYNNLSVFICTQMKDADLSIQKKLAKVAISMTKANGVKGRKERVQLINNFETSADLLFYLKNSIAFGRANYKPIIDRGRNA